MLVRALSVFSLTVLFHSSVLASNYFCVTEDFTGFTIDDGGTELILSESASIKAARFVIDMGVNGEGVLTRHGNQSEGFSLSCRDVGEVIECGRDSNRARGFIVSKANGNFVFNTAVRYLSEDQDNSSQDAEAAQVYVFVGECSSFG